MPGTVLSVRVHAALLGNSYPEDPHSGKTDLKAAEVQGNRHLTLEGTIVQKKAALFTSKFRVDKSE